MVESDESETKPTDDEEVAQIPKIVFEFGFPLIASVIAIICGSVQFASQKDDQNLNDPYCAIIMIVTGCIILASMLFKFAIRYFPGNSIDSNQERSNLINKIVIGLIVCCSLLLFVGIVLSISDIKSANELTTNPSTHNGSVDDDIDYAYSKFYTIPLLNIKDSSDADSEDNSIIDKLQEKYKCCGFTSYTDWGTSSVPDSCCRNESENCGINYNSTNYIFTQGCFTVIARIVIKQAVISMVISIVVILLDVISAKYTWILNICPEWLKDKVMARRDKNQINSGKRENKPENSNESDGQPESTSETSI